MERAIWQAVDLDDPKATAHQIVGQISCASEVVCNTTQCNGG
jgi:hypothetical protein